MTATTRTWMIELPPGLKLVNANDRYPHPAVRGALIRDLRRAAWVTACNARRSGDLPALPLDRVRIKVEYRPPAASRARDAGNWAPTGKALIDGLRDARIIPDDNSRHVTEESYVIGEHFPRGRMVLHITEDREAR